MHMPQPTEGHRRMQRMAGPWSGEEIMHPSQWDPKGGVATGKMDNRVDLDGFAVIGDYQQERDGKVTFSGHSVLTYDPKADVYTMHWFDCMGTPPEVFTGRMDGDRMVLAHGGPGMHARMTYEFVGAGELRSRMEMSQDGAGWTTLFEATYTRA
jgi:hypothetical protein